MQERTKRSAHQFEEAVHEAHDEPYDRAVTWIDDEKHATGELRAHRGQSNAFRRAAHNAIQDDDIGGRHRVGTLKDVGDSKGAPIAYPLLLRELARIRF